MEEERRSNPIHILAGKPEQEMNATKRFYSKVCNICVDGWMDCRVCVSEQL